MVRTPKKPRKVHTPGSGPVPVAKKKRGRPNKGVKVGTARKDNYRTKYTAEDYNKALEDIRSKALTIRAASKKYGIPRTTLGDKIKERVKLKVGRPTELSEEEENIITERLMLMAEWGFPMDAKDTRYVPVPVP